MTKPLLTSFLFVLLAACGSTSPAAPPRSSLTGTARQAILSLPLLVPRKSPATFPGASWMEPNAKNKSLLYISDVYNKVVYVLNYPKLTPAGVLTGFDEPEGLCTDPQGDVWVANTLDSEM